MPKRIMRPDGPYTTGEVARMFSTTTTTVTKWIRNGYLSAYSFPTKLGVREYVHRRISKDAVEAFLVANPTIPRPKELPV